MTAWKELTLGMSDGCARMFDAARCFAIGRGSASVESEHFLWAIFYNGYVGHAGYMLTDTLGLDVDGLLRRLAAKVGPGAVDYPLNVTLSAKLSLALRIAPRRDGKATELGVLIILLLDRANFLAHSVYASMPGPCDQRDERLAELTCEILRVHGIQDDGAIQELRAQVAAAPERVSSGPEPPQEFLCPIGGGIMSDPVSTATGQTYERGVIEQWLAHHGTDPLTNVVLTTREVLPNYSLRSLIERWLTQNVL